VRVIRSNASPTRTTKRAQLSPPGARGRSGSAIWSTQPKTRLELGYAQTVAFVTGPQFVKFVIEGRRHSEGGREDLGGLPGARERTR
jgi:hypothetical protein